MRWWHRLEVFVRDWLRPSAVDRELAEELRFHFDRQVQANVDAGLPLDEARRRARLLHKAPGFAAAAIAIVALGIGSVTAIFSVVYGVQLMPLPFRDPDRLVSVWINPPRRAPV